MEALQGLMKGRTSIIIAHHLGTILKADTIFVMKDHALVEQGTHDELMARGGVYSGLYQIQTEPQGEPAPSPPSTAAAGKSAL